MKLGCQILMLISLSERITPGQKGGFPNSFSLSILGNTTLPCSASNGLSSYKVTVSPLTISSLKLLYSLMVKARDQPLHRITFKQGSNVVCGQGENFLN